MVIHNDVKANEIQLYTITYWTDSMIVLKYIANETRRFTTFVASRVAAIRQESAPEQWRQVKSELNPADYASRGILASETSKLERWKRGPEFLWKSTEEWPTQPRDLAEGLDENDEGVKKEKVIVCGAGVEEEFWSQSLRRFSS
jgi:hypothetical protein